VESAGPAVLVVAIATLGNASDGAYIAAGLTAAAAIGGPVVGAMLDRSRHPRAGFALSMIVMIIGLIALLIALGRTPMWIAILLAGVAGLAYPALTGAWTAQLARLVPPPMLHRAYSADAGTYSLAAIIGPPLAAGVVAWNVSAPLVIPILVLVIAIITLRRVPLTPSPQHQQHKLLSDLRYGFHTLWHKAALRRTTIITVIGFGGEAALFITAPLLAQLLTGSLAFTGAILAARAIGGLLGAAFLVRHPVHHPDRVVVWGGMIVASTFVAMALFINIPVILIGAFIAGIAHGYLLSAMFQVRNRESDDRVRAQIFTTSASLRMTAFAAATAGLGALLTMGPSTVLIAGALLNIIAIVLGVALGPHVPRHRRTLRRPPKRGVRT
jgi:MFS family permease